MLFFLFSKTPLSFFIQSLWRDEAFSYFLAKKNILKIIFLTAKDFNPPLYYLMLHFWIKIFGSSEIALRSLSLIFYWATIYFIFLFLTEIFKIKNKLFLFLTLILLIINPLLTYYAFEARMYILLAFFSLWSSYAFLKQNKKEYLVACIFGLLTHYFMIFIFLSQIFSYYLFKKNLNKINLNLFKYPALVIVSWLIFVFIQNDKLLSDGFWIKKTDSFILKNFPAILFTGFEKDFGFDYPKIGSLSLLIFLMITISLLVKKNKKPAEKLTYFYLFTAGFIFPFIILLISYFKPIFLPRYLIGSSLLLVLLLIFILNKLEKKFFSFFILILFLYFSFDYQKLQIKFRKKSNYRKLYQEIKILAKKDDFVYVSSELDYFVACYYFDKNRVRIFSKTYEEIPSFVGKILIPKEAITFSLPIYPKKAFIISDNNYTIQATF